LWIIVVDVISLLLSSSITNSIVISTIATTFTSFFLFLIYIITGLCRKISPTWLIKQLVWVRIIVFFCFLFHQLLEIYLKPFFGTFTLIGFFDKICMYIFNMFYCKLLTFENLRTFFTTVLFTTLYFLNISLTKIN